MFLLVFTGGETKLNFFFENAPITGSSGRAFNAGGESTFFAILAAQQAAHGAFSRRLHKHPDKQANAHTGHSGVFCSFCGCAACFRSCCLTISARMSSIEQYTRQPFELVLMCPLSMCLRSELSDIRSIAHASSQEIYPSGMPSSGVSLALFAHSSAVRACNCRSRPARFCCFGSLLLISRVCVYLFGNLSTFFIIF